MDKRTLIFILLVGAAFFGLNYYFSSSNDEKARQEEVQLAEKKKLQQIKLQSQLEKQIAPIESLPIVNLYNEEKNIVGQGLNVNGSTLILAWADPLPKTIYVKNENGFASQTLLTEPTVINGPALYGRENFKNLHIVSLPEQGKYEVQFISFTQAGPKVNLAIYEQGNLSFPLEIPDSNGFALYKADQGFLPLGFYEKTGRVFIELQNLPLFSPLIAQEDLQKTVVKEQKENFYVLENPYFQVVFSSVGGAVSEINLPFTSEENQKSVVKEIGFDREIAEKDSPNASFPLYPYFSYDSKTQEKVGQTGGYYPLLRRDLKKGSNVKKVAPEFYAFNIVSEYPELAELPYTVKEFDQNHIVFEALQSFRKITKTYSVDSSVPYILNVSIKIDGDSRGLWLTSGVPEVELISGNFSPQIQYRMTRKAKSEVEKLDLPKPKEVVTLSSIHPDWIVNSNGYLGIIMDPLDEISAGYRARAILGNSIPTRLSLIDPQYQPYKAADYPGYEVLLPLPSRGGSVNFRIFAGPFEESVLKTVDQIYTENGNNPDYIACQTFYGWFSFISEPFAKFLFIVMKFFYQVTNSWAASIILLTIVLRILLYPLNAWSFKSMKRMQQVSPQVQAIQAKYKKDPKKAQVEIMNLYREKKVNPFTGCLPILIQMPFLIGMFDLLKSTFPLRGASFIPGWIDNLTAPDVLFEWSYPIFFIGNQFHLLPVLLGVVMYLQQRFTSSLPKDKTLWTDQQRQQRTMGNIMTVVFTVMFYHFPSGLNIYWLSSMILGIIQQWLTNRMLDKKPLDEKNPQKGTLEIKKAKG